MKLWQTIRFSVAALRLARVPTWPPEKVARLRNRRLQRLVEIAVARAPFYANRYRGINLNRFELSQLPPTTKQDLLAHFDEAVTDPNVRRSDVERYLGNSDNLGRYYLGRYAVSETSGSQGQPLPILQDRQGLEVLFGIMIARANAFSRPGLIEGVRRLLHPARLAIVTLRRGFYPSGAAFEFMSEIVRPYVRVARLSSTQIDLIERLNEFQPHVVIGYASTLDTLAFQADKLHLAPHLRQVGSTSERLSGAAKQRIQSAFGVPVIDHYGAGECLFLSDGCPTDEGVHVNADWAILEVVDDANRPVPPGLPGSKVLLTNLANVVQPFIRYEISDTVTMADRPCRCGNRFPRVQRVDGRAAEVFRVWDGKEDRVLPALVVQNAVERLGVVREWQAAQADSRGMEIRLEVLPKANLIPIVAQQILTGEFQQLGLPAGFKVEVRVVPHLLPDPRTGKMRRVVQRGE
jgi:phenylacetate-CoA ligase